jgi:SAM-dependent methyltransferase
MITKDFSPILQYHHHMLKWYGEQSPLALGWRDWQSQAIRFEVLSNIADLNGRSVLDAGCGHADLLDFLRKIYPDLGFYCGFEEVPELLNVAVKRHRNEPGVSLVAGDFLIRQMPLMDYVFASGSLSYANLDPKFIYSTISRLYERCKMGFGFNLLSEVSKNDILVSYDPGEILSYCQTLSKKVELVDGYDDQDFTVFMYR